MQNQYTRQAERAIKYAAAMARKLKHPYIGTEHLLLGLRSEITGVAGQGWHPTEWTKSSFCI